MTFQDVILTLQRFWAEKGCLIVQPYNSEVGAGTYNPATFLRAIGPEPWNVAFVEPSRRPSDGRYGDNPNRMQQFHQFQVILKPSPLDVQELYLDSLRALGLDLTRHDIRFEEDNWESPTLGAWGVGCRSCSTVWRSRSSHIFSRPAASTSRRSPRRSPMAWSA